MAVVSAGGGADPQVVLLDNNGSGRFSKRSEPEGVSSAWALVAADLDGDGDEDLAVTSDFAALRSAVDILINDGSGNFHPRSTSPEALPGDRVPTDIIAADLDRDGDRDLAVPTWAVNGAKDGEIIVLFNTGRGDFKTRSTSRERQRGRDPWSVASADFNGDGSSDLATANDLSQNVSVLLNGGFGDLSEPPTSPFEPRGRGAGDVATGDFDRDGRPDLAITTVGHVSVLLNRTRACTKTGSPGNDIIRGTSGDDVICAGSGNYVVYGGGGNDTIRGGAGNDVLRGGGGDDRLTGGPGRDTLYGNGGADSLDTQDARRGNDVARGGAGADSCATDRRDVRSSC